MNMGMHEVINELERLSRYEGAWTVLRRENELLRARVAELRQREDRLDDLLLVALVGGSGTGKSTLLNALAGDELAATSEFRPCTSVPTVYHPPGARLEFEGWNHVSGAALERLAVIDTPDSDTVVREHRAIVEKALSQCDLILICGSPEKYLDEATWSLLRPLQQERTFVCVETKASPSVESVRDHWLARLREQGFAAIDYFRVSALRAFERKIAGRQPAPSEFEFPRLEHFLREQLTHEQVRRIKRSNASGLLMKTVLQLHERVGSKLPDLERSRENLHARNLELIKEAGDLVGRRLFAEPHLWNYALGREMALRAKGIVGTLYRVLEAIRSLPARLGGWLPRLGRGHAGQRAAALLADSGHVIESSALLMGDLEELYRVRVSDVNLELAQAGFDLPAIDDGFETFQGNVNAILTHVLRGPARDRLVARARVLTCWPLSLLADIGPIAFMGFSGYKIVKVYFSGALLTGAFFIHSATVLAIILVLELAVLSIASRFAAWTARQAAVGDFRRAFVLKGNAFAFERNALDAALDEANRIETLHAVVASEIV